MNGLTSIVVLVHNKLALSKLCIDSVLEHTARELELVIVDNGSTEDVSGYVEELRHRFDRVRFIRNEENQGYAFGCNQGLAHAQGEYVVLLNNDTVVTAGWLDRLLVLLATDSRIGLVGPRTNYSAGPQQVDAVTYEGLEQMHRFAANWSRSNAGRFELCPRVTGVCMVMRRALIDEIGGLDTIFGIGNFEDDDFCLRAMRAGYVHAIAHDVFIHHYGSATFRAIDRSYETLLRENARFFAQKWGLSVEELLTNGYPPLDVARSRAFDPALDYIPPSYSAVFSPSAAPCGILGAAEVRFLCIPDWDDIGCCDILETYLTAFNDDSQGVSLTIRLEPPTNAVVDEALAHIRSLLSELAIEEETCPDIEVGTLSIPARLRGGLYTAATAYLVSPGCRSELYTREAEACGVPIVERPTAAQLRQIADSRPEPTWRAQACRNAR